MRDLMRDLTRDLMRDLTRDLTCADRLRTLCPEKIYVACRSLAE